MTGRLFNPNVFLMHLISRPASFGHPGRSDVTAWVVMGVSGCGKSSLAAALARRLGWPLIEGDDFHPPTNKAKMSAGQPLVDADRIGWLDRLGDELRRHPNGAVLSCSALKRHHRDRLRTASPGLRFAYLELDQPTAQARVSARSGHFFSPTLVTSQFEALEPPIGEPGVVWLDATRSLAALVDAVMADAVMADVVTLDPTSTGPAQADPGLTPSAPAPDPP